MITNWSLMTFIGVGDGGLGGGDSSPPDFWVYGKFLGTTGYF